MIVKYNLWKVRTWVSDAKKYDIGTYCMDRQDLFISESSSIAELIEKVNSFPRKGNAPYREEFQIWSVDEHGDQISLKWTFG